MGKQVVNKSRLPYLLMLATLVLLGGEHHQKYKSTTLDRADFRVDFKRIWKCTHDFRQHGKRCLDSFGCEL